MIQVHLVRGFVKWFAGFLNIPPWGFLLAPAGFSYDITPQGVQGS